MIAMSLKTFFIAPPLLDSTSEALPFQLLTPAELLEALGFLLNSPTLKFSCGLIDLGWRYAIPRMKNVIAISFGSPYLLREIPSVQNYVCAYGIQPPLQVAVAQALFGEILMTGRLPVTIPGS